MDFGKVDLTDLPHIDLSLPADDPRSAKALALAHARSKSRKPQRIGVGAPVWGVKEWVGKVYPKGTLPKDFLQAYARQFNSIELNSTHYGIPDEPTIARWRDATPAGFKFNVKFLQNISHQPRLDANAFLTRQFCESILGLGDRLGISFLQLPPSFTIDDLPRLKRFFFQIPRSLPIAVEVRHPSFFDEHRLVAPYYDLLAEAEAHVVITDVAGRRDVLHSSLPSSRVLVRFVGNSVGDALHATDSERIDAWILRLKSWLQLGLDQVEFFVHQPDNTLSPELITHVIDRLNSECDFNLPKWQPVADSTPKQLTFF